MEEALRHLFFFDGIWWLLRPIGDTRDFELTAPKRPFVSVPRPPKSAPHE
jgi:hypothetical protein